MGGRGVADKHGVVINMNIGLTRNPANCLFRMREIKST